MKFESSNLTNDFPNAMLESVNSSYHYIPIDGGIFLEMPGTNESAEFPEVEPLELPLYIRLTASLLILIILVVGTIGNTMVIIVISCSRDMRTSTNFFLVNLSVADLMVLIFVTPTALIEAMYDPEQWLFGKTMCYIVVPLEMTVCHASVLTILAISFERYLVICTPLKANYVCTRARAVYICALVWLLAIIITSPLFFMTGYHDVPEVPKPICLVGAGTFWPDLYTLSSTLLFFFVPLIMMIVTYALISHKLCPQTRRRTRRPALLLNVKVESQRGRRQVVIMLGAVVFTFFFCLLPFRILTVVAVVTDYGGNFTGRTEIDYAILFLVRIMVYANSALNPILYSVCSTKFRKGFQNLCGRTNSNREYIFHRNGTFLTLTANNLHQNNNRQTNPNRSSYTTPNHSSACSTNKTYLSRSPSTSPDLVLNQGLVRKNGIIRRDRNLSVSTVNVKVVVNQVPRSQTRQDSNINNTNPKLTKKFLYAYVSGHKSECMV